MQWIIMDVVVLAVLAGFVTAGIRRGLVRAAAGLLSTVIAVAGAGVISQAATPLLMESARPVMEARIAERLDQALAEAGLAAGQSGVLPDLESILELLPIDETTAQTVLDAAWEKIRGTGVTALMAVVESLAENMLRTVLFTISFAVLTLLLRLVVGTLNLAAELPGLHTLNQLGGGALGALEGTLCIYLAIAVLGLLLGTSFTEQTHILRFFVTHNPLSALTFSGG